MNILIATYPFGECGTKPIDILKYNNFNLFYNPYNRRLKVDNDINEVKNLIKDVDGVLAGTEPYNREAIENAKNLKVISRVGIGLDNIDFYACKDCGVIVTYTPEAPSDGVADLTIAQIINLTRGIYVSDSLVKKGRWDRTIGKLISEIYIGVLGVGRIGSRVIDRLIPFGANIYACDIDEKVIDKYKNIYRNVKWVSKKELFEKSDLVTVHIPLNKRNSNYINSEDFSLMKKGSFIINTSRGPILNENDLIKFIKNGHLGGCALDVFSKEPYFGPLSNFDNVILTAHISSSANKCRYLMELGAAEDCVRVLNGEKPENLAMEII